MILTTKAIDDLCQKYLVDGGVIGVRRCKKEDLKRIAAGALYDAGVHVVCLTHPATARGSCPKAARPCPLLSLALTSLPLDDRLPSLAAATGGTLIPNLADLEGGETFDASMLGSAEEVSEERVGDGDIIFIRGCKTTKAVSVLLRGANEYLLDEMDRWVLALVVEAVSQHRDGAV